MRLRFQTRNPAAAAQTPPIVHRTFFIPVAPCLVPVALPGITIPVGGLDAAKFGGVCRILVEAFMGVGERLHFEVWIRFDLAVRLGLGLV